MLYFLICVYLWHPPQASSFFADIIRVPPNHQLKDVVNLMMVCDKWKDYAVKQPRSFQSLNVSENLDKAVYLL